MMCPNFLITALQVFVTLVLINITSSQRTIARQGAAKEPPAVRIPDQGTVVGREILLARPQKVTVYLGIPYAQPPVGQRRFRPPVTDPPVSWEGTRNATQFAPSCLQSPKLRKLHEKLFRQLLSPDFEEPGVSENCLYLNIYVPDGPPPKDGWPVIVWFHGGDFNIGSPALWDATVFVNKQKILVVTVAYRLNIFGFFTTTDGEAPGNYGMLDQVAALNWVQKNIEFFDGSADNVTIAGHSSGGISVGLHILSPLSRGKFSKAIVMSGDAINSVRTPEQELPVIELVTEKFTCLPKPTSKLMECLRRALPEVLLDQTYEIETWGPIVDADTNNSSEAFLPYHPRDILEMNNFNAVPLMAGYTSNEQALAYIEAANNREDDITLSPAKFDNTIADEITQSIQKPDNASTCEAKPHLVTEAVLFFYRPYPPSDDASVYRDRYLDLQTDKNYAAGLTLLAGKVAKYKKAFVYRFDYRSRTMKVIQDIPLWAGVPHMFELPFVWGLPHVFPSHINWSNSDKNLADVMMMLFGNFVRTEEGPSLNNVRWEPYTELSPGILVINRTISMSEVEGIDYRALAFWNDYFPTIVEESMNQCCNATSGAVGQTNWSCESFVAYGVMTLATFRVFVNY